MKPRRRRSRPTVPSHQPPVAPLNPWISSAMAGAPRVDVLGADRLTPSEVTQWGGLVSHKPSPALVRQILDAALAGDFGAQSDLLTRMLDTWPRFRKALDEICSEASRIEWEVHPAAAGKGVEPTPSAIARADLVRQSLGEWAPEVGTDELGLEDSLYQLTGAVPMGISAVELLWNRAAGGTLRPRAGCCVPSSLLGWDGQAGRMVARLDGAQIALQSPKFLVGMHRSGHGPMAAWGLLRPLAWWWCAAQWGREWLLTYAQTFGAPFRWVNHDATMAQADLDRLDAMLGNMGAQGWARFPAGATLSYIESKGGGGQDNPQRVLIDLADRACDILLLGQTLTTDVGASGSRALGDVHEGVREARVCRLSRWLGDILSYQLAPEICRLNFGDASESPVICPDNDDAPDPDKVADRLLKWLEAGVQVPASWAHEQTGVPVPRDGELVLQPRAKAPPVPAGGPPIGGALLGMQAELAHALGVPRTWLNPVREWIADVEQRLADGTIPATQLVAELEAAQRRLPEVFRGMDHAALAEVIAAASQRAAARVDPRAATRG